MKALILSDIHSNAQALQAIWAAEEGIDVIYGAGDYTDYGPQPAEAVEWMAAHGVRAVFGNHDQVVMQTWAEGRYPDTPSGEVRWAEDNCRRMTQAHVDALKALPERLYFEMDGIAYLMQHRCGQGYETIDCLEAFDAYWEAHSPQAPRPGVPRRMIFGHTHRQVVQMFSDDAMWLNPGSASYRRPDETSKDAYYMVIDNGTIRFRHVPYDRRVLSDEVMRAKAWLHPMEWHVANYFFCLSPEDGRMIRPGRE